MLNTFGGKKTQNISLCTYSFQGISGFFFYVWSRIKYLSLERTRRLSESLAQEPRLWYNDAGEKTSWATYGPITDSFPRRPLLIMGNRKTFSRRSRQQASTDRRRNLVRTRDQSRRPMCTAKSASRRPEKEEGRASATAHVPYIMQETHLSGAGGGNVLRAPIRSDKMRTRTSDTGRSSRREP